MKKKFLFVSAITALSGSILFSSCIGSFALSSKVLAWNKTIDNKFVNEVVFFALNIVPVYSVCLLADGLVLNAVEFWSGENPVEAGIVKQVQGQNGVYTVETLDNGYQIKNEEGNAMELIYDKKSNTWSMVQNDESTKLIEFTEDNNAIVYLPDGNQQKVELSANGVLAFRQSLNSYHYAMK